MTCAVFFAFSHLPLKVFSQEQQPLETAMVKRDSVEKDLSESFNSSTSSSIQVIRGGIEYSNIKDVNYEKILSKDDILILDLRTVLEMAMDKNLSIDIQEYTVKAARDRLIGRTGAFLPNVSFIQDIARREGNIQLFGDQTIEVRQTSYQPRSDTRFTLFQGGRVLFGWISSKNLLKSSKQDLTQAVQDSLTSVSTTFFELQRFQAELETELRRLEQAELNLKQRKIALDLGDDIKLSVLLAQQEVDQAKSRIATLKGNYYSQSARLNELLNLPYKTLIVPMAESIESKIIRWQEKPTLETLIGRAISNNPKLQSKQYEVKAARADQIATVANFLPEAGVQSVNGFIGPDYSSLVSNNVYSFYVRYDILSNLGVSPVANYLEAKHNKERNKKEFELLTKQTEQQVSQNYLNVISGEEVLNSNISALNASEEAYRQALARLKAEVGTPYELKVAQTDLARARADYYQSLVNFKVSQLQLINVLGLSNVNNIVEGVDL
ncbi:MAG: TolC family protein [Candidatus Caenarcaniphilales bacterium]|nr:TolC family protein [Candidatus Caenarcaniphilales bacterium]